MAKSKSGNGKKKNDGKVKAPPLQPEKEIVLDRKIARMSGENQTLKKKYKILMGQLEKAERDNETFATLKGPLETFKIDPKTPSGTSEATAVLVASDWHGEEKVDPATVNGKNKYNLELAEKGAEQFFKNGLRLIEIQRQATTIKTLVLALLGDFITNNIHEELVEINQLSPVEATLFVQKLLASGIEFLLKNGKFDEIIIPCLSGNHGRTTAKVHVSTEKGHSLEYMMYAALAERFKHESKIKFILGDGYHIYLKAHDVVMRFHHGHQVRYQGGVGGIYIPANKAIAQWNKIKWADLDIFGHFHQCKKGGNFITNGSLIGYNAYALSIKADYERPKQMFFLIDRKRGLTIDCPILFDDRCPKVTV